jgi:hypothetical protein
MPFFAIGEKEPALTACSTSEDERDSITFISFEEPIDKQLKWYSCGEVELTEQSYA